MLIMRIHRAAGELREAKWLQWCADAAVEGGVRGGEEAEGNRREDGVEGRNLLNFGCYLAMALFRKAQYLQGSETRKYIQRQ